VGAGGGDDAGCGEVYEPPGTSSAHAVHHCALGDLWIFSSAASDCGGDCAVSGEEPAGGAGSADAVCSGGGAWACAERCGLTAAGAGAESGQGDGGGAGSDEGVSEAGGAGTASGAGWGGAGAVVAEERGGLLPRSLPARALDRSGVEGSDDAGIEERLEDGGAALQAEAGERTLAQTDARDAGSGDGIGGGSGAEKLAEE